MKALTKVLALTVGVMVVWAAVSTSPGAPATRPVAASVVFLIQASGAMLSRLPDVTAEVQAAIDGLTDEQKFTVIVSHGNDIRPQQFRNSLTAASKNNKDAAAKFLESVKAQDANNLLPAFKLAFADRPAVIWLASNGDNPNNQALLDGVRSMKGAAPTRVDTTTAFCGNDDGAKAILYALAKATGGICIDSSGHPYSPPKPRPAAPPTTMPRRTGGSSIFHE